MAFEYLHLPPETDPTQLPTGPLRVVIVSETAVSENWRDGIARWLVDGGCLYALAWGTGCEEWHDAVDRAVLESFDYGQIPDESHVMTTWHADQPLSEVLWFAQNCAFHPDADLEQAVMLHIAEHARPDELMALYAASRGQADP